MRDKHHADPLLLQALDDRKQALAFVSIQRRGGFIQNQKTAVVRQGPRQQNLLLFGESAAVDGTTNVEGNIQLRQGLLRLFANRTPAIAMTRLRQIIEHDVFGDA
ncbi:hypothetical protein D3C72_1811880 [compost metagenome]